MFHHIVLMRFTPESTAEQHLAIAEALRALPQRLPEIVHYDVHLDARLNDANAHLSVSSSFASQADWQSYSDDPTHQAIIAKQIRPILDTILRTQFTN